MRICLVSREVAPFWGAGIGTYVSLMAKAWTEAGHEVHILTEPHEGILERGPKVRPGVRFHVVNTGQDLAGRDGHHCGAMRHAMAVYEKLEQLHTAHPFDYIELPDFGGEAYFTIRAKQTLGTFDNALIALRLHTPLTECRELNLERWLDRRSAVTLHMEDEALRGADALISPSTSLLDMLKARLGGTLIDKPGFVVPYPFDSDAAAELGRAVPEQSHTPTVLYYGRYERRKGVTLLVQAAQRLLEKNIDARFRFIGRDTHTGPMGSSMLEHLRSMVEPQWQDRIIFEDPRPRAELAGAIAGATVCCFPSLWENYPNVCLESMAMGKLVVGSDAGGMSEMIEHGASGLLFKSGDSADLAKQLKRALTDTTLRAQIERASPQRVRSLCDPTKVVAQTTAAIEASTKARQTVTTTTPSPTERNGHDAPLVSVIIPFYNLGEFLPQTLASLDRQTCRDFETILVDDGSTDKASIALIDQLEQAGGLQIVRKTNGGLSSARNAGLAAARGQWILPLDADDVLDPMFIEKCLAAAARDPGLTYVTTLVSCFATEPEQPGAIWIPLGLDRDLLPVINVGGCCTALMDRKTLVDIGGYDEWLRSYEDWDLYCTLAERGCRGTVLPQALFHYRRRLGSMQQEIGGPKMDEYRAYLASKHPALASRPERALQFMLGEVKFDQRVYLENPRYQIIDRINAALKKTPLHGTIKGLAMRVMKMRG